MKTIAIIMAGGSGERFWPLSRCAYPKQLLRIRDNEHMLAMAIGRISPVVPVEDIYILTTEKLADAIRRELPDLPSGNVIAEPEGRNTAACLALAAAMVNQRYGEDVISIVLTADHFIHDERSFQNDCRAAAEFAEANEALLTFGIRPTRAETGYGYIEAGESASNRFPIFRVNSFREKPDADTARRFLKDGDFFWNSGMFVWRNSVFIAELRRHMPAMSGALPEMQDALAAGPAGDAALAAVYQRLEKISIDVGLMERSDKVFMIRASFDWDDIGTWASLFRIIQPDAAGNAVYGNGLFIQSQNSIAYSVDGAEHSRLPLVVGYNVDGLVIVRTPDAILVLPAEDVQRVKDVVAFLRANGKEEYL